MSNGDVDIIFSFKSQDEFCDWESLTVYMFYKGKRVSLFVLCRDIYMKEDYMYGQEVAFYNSLVKIIEGFVQIKDNIFKYGYDWLIYSEDDNASMVEFLKTYHNDIDKALKDYIYDQNLN